jgi:branched-chain amino acid transport system substrate-binding protein
VPVIRRTAVVLFALLVAVACAPSASTRSQLVLGAIYPLSGPQAEGGNHELAGVEAALRVANANVRLQVIDATTPQAASAAVDTLVKKYHVPVILGTYGSTLSAAASARAEELKTVYWETGAVADPITTQRHYVFRTVATGGSLGRMAVTFTRDVLVPRYGLTRPRAVVVRVNDIYGRSVGGGEADLARSLGIEVVDTITYNPGAFDPDAMARRIALDRADFLWDVSYLNDGVAIWQAIVRNQVHVLAAVGTSSAFCMPDFGRLLGSAAIGVYAADKPDATINRAALSPAGRTLLAKATASYLRIRHAPMSIPGVAGFVGGWTLFHDVLPALKEGTVTPDAIRTAAYAVDDPPYSAINGGGVRFARPGTPNAGQNLLAPALVGQWQAVNTMKVVYPEKFAQADPDMPGDMEPN